MGAIDNSKTVQGQNSKGTLYMTVPKDLKLNPSNDIPADVRETMPAMLRGRMGESMMVNLLPLNDEEKTTTSQQPAQCEYHRIQPCYGHGEQHW